MGDTNGGDTMVPCRCTRLREVIPGWRSGAIQTMRRGTKFVIRGDYFARDGRPWRVTKVVGRTIWARGVCLKERRLDTKIVSYNGPVKVLYF